MIRSGPPRKCRVGINSGDVALFHDRIVIDHEGKGLSPGTQEGVDLRELRFAVNHVRKENVVNLGLQKGADVTMGHFDRESRARPQLRPGPR